MNSLSPSAESNGIGNYRGPAKASWIILGLACIASAVPFLGFASWLVAGPLLVITLILGIVVISRGGTAHGIVILLATLIGAPVFIFVAPFVSSLLGLAGTGAAIEHADRQARANATYVRPVVVPVTPAVPSVPMQSATGQAPQDTQASVPAPLAGKTQWTDDFDKVKQVLQKQSPQVFKLKGQNMVREGPRGYLTSSDKLDLAQREVVQRENYNREQIFAIIAKRTGTTPEEVAATFARLAGRFGGGSPAAPP